MKRVVVIGVSGSGKTTLANELARRLNIPCIHSDELAWEANWQRVTQAEFLRRIASATEKEDWVFDGSRLSLRDFVWPRATTLVWLDYSLPVVSRRICIRNFGRLMTGEELWNGNKENWRRALGGVRHSMQTFTAQTRRIPSAIAEFPHLKVIRLRSPREALDWLRTVK
jgi:adenylate kinase family enzyme